MDRKATASLCTALLLAAGIAGGGFSVEKRLHAGGGGPRLRPALDELLSGSGNDPGTR